ARRRARGGPPRRPASRRSAPGAHSSPAARTAPAAQSDGRGRALRRRGEARRAPVKEPTWKRTDGIWSCFLPFLFRALKGPDSYHNLRIVEERGVTFQIAGGPPRRAPPPPRWRC